MAVTEDLGQERRRRLVVHRIQRVVGSEEGHSHAAVGHMEAARAERSGREVGGMARHIDHPAVEEHRNDLVEAGGSGLAEGGTGPGEGHRKVVVDREAVDSPGEVLEEGHVVRIPRKEALLTELADASIPRFKICPVWNNTHGLVDMT